VTKTRVAVVVGRDEAAGDGTGVGLDSGLDVAGTNEARTVGICVGVDVLPPVQDASKSTPDRSKAARYFMDSVEKRFNVDGPEVDRGSAVIIRGTAALPGSVTVAQEPLELRVQVRILARQPALYAKFRVNSHYSPIAQSVERAAVNR
jgi:hypothetical protein